MEYQRFYGTIPLLPTRIEAQAMFTETQKKKDEEKKQQTEALKSELNRMLAELRAMTSNREATMSKFLSQTSIPHRPPFPPPEPPDLAKLFESPLLHTPAIHPRVPFSPNQNQNNQGSSIQQIEPSGVKDVISTNRVLSNGSSPEEESRPEEASTHKADSDFGEETITCNASKSSQVPSHVSLYHLPVFDGTLPNCWIVEVDRFFELKQYGNEEKLDLISLSLEGAALKWFRRHRREFTDWTDLKRKLMARFGLVKGCSPPEVLPMHRAPFNPYYKNPYATPLLPATETIGIPFSKPDFTPTPYDEIQATRTKELTVFDEEPYIRDHQLKYEQPQIFVKDCEDASMSDDEANYETNSVLEKETCPSSALCQRIPATQPQNNNMTQQEELIQDIETIREIGPIQEHESPKLTDAILEVDCVHSQEFSSQFQVPIPSLEPSRRCHKESLVVVNDLSYDHGCVTGLNLGKLLKNERLFSTICLLGLNDMSCWTQLLRQQIFPKSWRFKFKSNPERSKFLDDMFSFVEKSSERYVMVWESHLRLLGSQQGTGLSLLNCLVAHDVLRLWICLGVYNSSLEAKLELSGWKYKKRINQGHICLNGLCKELVYVIDKKKLINVKDGSKKDKKLDHNLIALHLQICCCIRGLYRQRGTVYDAENMRLLDTKDGSSEVVAIWEVNHFHVTDFSTTGQKLLLVKEIDKMWYKEDSWLFMQIILKGLCASGVEMETWRVKKSLEWLNKLTTATNLAQMFMDHVCKPQGTPQDMLSDRDPTFLIELFRVLRTDLSPDTTYEFIFVQPRPAHFPSRLEETSFAVDMDRNFQKEEELIAMSKVHHFQGQNKSVMEALVQWKEHPPD